MLIFGTPVSCLEEFLNRWCCGGSGDKDLVVLLSDSSGRVERVSR